MNRGVVIGGAVVLLLGVGAAALLWSGPAGVEVAPEAATPKPPVVSTRVPVPGPVERRLTAANRVSMTTGRARRDDVPTLKFSKLEDPKETHRLAVQELRSKVLQPCAPRPSLTEENTTRRIEVDYVLQATGIVEVQLRGVDEAREEEPVAPNFLDCVGKRLEQVEGPGVPGEVQQRFVFAYRSAG